MNQIILASASPRRKELLKQLGLSFKVAPGRFKEDMSLNMPPAKLAEYLSFKKAEVVAKKYPKAVIISADTLVVLKGKVLGKPKNLADAEKILRSLSGRVHQVITGFTVLSQDKIISKSDAAKIKFRKLSNREITDYIKTKEPLDKAGAYAIQGRGGIFVETIVGDYTNVVGLPITSLIKQLKKFGIKI